MSVRIKLIAIILSIIISVIVILYFISNQILLKSYLQIENASVINNIQRVEDALTNEESELSLKLVDWAEWDDTYKFIQDKNKEFIKSNLNNSSLTNLKLNAMVFFDENRNLVFKKEIDSGLGEDIVTDDLINQLTENPKFFSQKTEDEFLSGIMQTSKGPFLYSSHAILTSLGSGPSRGTLIFGRFITQQEIDRISKITHVPVELIPYNDTNQSTKTAIRNLSPKTKNAVIPSSNQEIHGYSAIKDISGKPIYLIHITLPRTLYQQGVYTLGYLMKISFFFSIVSVIIMVFALNRFIFSRFVKLTRTVQEISTTHDLKTKIKEDGNDEIGHLGRSINEMLLELAGSQQAEKEAIELLREEKASVEKQVIERTEALSKAKDDISKGWLQIQQEKVRLTASINSLPLGFIMTDADGNVLIHNPIVTKIFNLVTDEWKIADVFKKIASKIDLSAHISNSIVERKQVVINDIQLESTYLKITIVPILTHHTDVIGTVILVEDITEAKVLERARDEFFSIASHELRTPLTSIKGNTALIKQYYSEMLNDKNLKEMIDDIHESSNRLILIVNDFLDVSRIEQGRITYNIENINCIEIVQGVIHDLQISADEKNIKLSIDNQATNPIIKGDKDRVQQIIYNLVGNALKFTDNGDVKVELKNKENKVEVRIIDTGTGISADGQALLFRKFQQASDNPLTRKSSSGTGLGLYISKTLAIGMRGDVTLEHTEPGKGSTFLLTLPESAS